jgi:hypothetical protein
MHHDFALQVSSKLDLVLRSEPKQISALQFVFVGLVPIHQALSTSRQPPGPSTSGRGQGDDRLVAKSAASASAAPDASVRQRMSTDRHKS